MGRRGFGFSAFSRLAASIRASEKRNERESLIQQQAGTAKRLPPTYSIHKFDFNEETRLATVTIIRSEKYRTIDRYITQNYQRYPIYSNWKTKTTYSEKKLKLTNLNLEKLNCHEDPLICKFADEIIYLLKNPDLIPSWLTKKLLYEEQQDLIHNESIRKQELQKDFTKHSNEFLAHIADLETKIRNAQSEKEEIDSKIDKKNKQITKIEARKISIPLIIITLGLYLLSFTKERRKQLESKRTQLLNKSAEKEKFINKQQEEIKDTKQKRKEEEEKLNADFAEIEKTISEIANEYQEKIKNVQALPTTCTTDSEFIPLKKFNGFEYQKIIGCYIIQNIENKKVYVGQSKDVLKRIKQHFRGTTPNNIIFAEDYYSVPSDKRDSLFEIKIIKLATKDELDRTEKQLISEYEANTKGYNSTKGNE